RHHPALRVRPLDRARLPRRRAGDAAGLCVYRDDRAAVICSSELVIPDKERSRTFYSLCQLLLICFQEPLKTFKRLLRAHGCAKQTPDGSAVPYRTSFEAPGREPAQG